MDLKLTPDIAARYKNPGPRRGHAQGVPAPARGGVESKPASRPEPVSLLATISASKLWRLRESFAAAALDRLTGRDPRQLQARGYPSGENGANSPDRMREARVNTKGGFLTQPGAAPGVHAPGCRRAQLEPSTTRHRGPTRLAHLAGKPAKTGLSLRPSSSWQGQPRPATEAQISGLCVLACLPRPVCAVSPSFATGIPGRGGWVKVNRGVSRTVLLQAFLARC